MNSIFVAVQFQSGERVIINGDYLAALRERHKLDLGRTYALGLEGRGRALAELTVLTDHEATFQICGPVEPLQREPIKLIVGIARPQTVKKVLHVASSFGVTELVFIRSERAEKSYFQSAVLLPQHLRDEVILGVEQGWDHELPQVTVLDRFRPFVEDELTKQTGRKIILSTRTAIADQPTGPIKEQLTLAVGPEAGWNEFEEELLIKAGFSPLSLGKRMLRVEVALAVGLGRLQF
jgi:RsmE family RNA methyltransferase